MDVDVVRGEALPSERALPRRRPARAGPGEPPRPGPGFRGGEWPPSPSPSRWRPHSLAGLTVLVVDDDAASLDYFATALRTAGAAVATATNAIDALGVLERTRADVVLTDIAMPGQDGYWLVRQIRGLPEPAGRVPVVATTAYGRVHSRERSLAGGFADHLAKPVDPVVLCATIARAAGRPA